MDLTTAKYNKRKSTISNRPLTINESIQRLNLCAYMQLLDGASNLATTIGNAVQLYSVLGSKSRSMTFMGSAVVLGLFLITIGNMV
jgi:hypothetical protein